MQTPIFRYQQDPFRIFSTNPAPIFPNKNKPDHPIYYYPIKEKSNLKGLFIALFAVLTLILIFIYRKTIMVIILKIMRKDQKIEENDFVEMEEYGPKVN
ncbi:hypothetical protein [Lacihabitans soyangensis]|uniref:Uncharacterized protein n=1 Tax=Lacihabitans soyangensis TaxID=869394 RepID=A0AAE3H0Z3_9BACT|nr:hypothetical protein [Lacihabitans soyangensis]MCP9762290.1 hypothetical protein [Lacihabitans soyangensis]